MQNEKYFFRTWVGACLCLHFSTSYLLFSIQQVVTENFQLIRFQLIEVIKEFKLEIWRYAVNVELKITAEQLCYSQLEG